LNVSAETDLIRKIDFFEPLEQKIIEKIAHVCIAREYSAGDYIVKQGESGLGLFFITRGCVKVEVDRDGKRTVVAQLKAEDFLGEMSIIDNKPRSASVICLEDTSCLLLTRDTFSKLMNKYPEIAIQMAKALAGRIRAANEMMGKTGGIAAESVPAPPPPVVQPAAPAESAVKTERAANNGSGPSTKNKVRDFLVDTFSSLYTMKALTRFSAAVVGCPVTVRPEMTNADVAQDHVGEVKLLLFPAAARGTLHLEAYGEGPYSAVILRPGAKGPDISSFAGRVRRNESIHLHIPAAGAPHLT
jgi:CRP-like cAMP-binding protein